MREIRLMLVEDHTVLAQTLAVALRTQGFEVVTPTALTQDAVIEQAGEQSPDVVLLDLDLGTESSGLPMIAPLRELGLEVIVVTGASDGAILGECLEAGASGVFRKSEPFEGLIDSILLAARHSHATSSSARESLLRELRERRASDVADRRPFERLTQREREVLGRLIEGRSAETIAADLVVSIATVRSQIRAILSKLGVNSQLEAVAKAHRARWSPD